MDNSHIKHLLYGDAQGAAMSTNINRLVSRSCGLVLFASALICSASADAAYNTPARPDAIEQAASTVFNGATFVRLIGVSCPGRGDGYFVVPNNAKQALQLDILLNALRQGIRVTMSHDPGTCLVSTVGTCANNRPC
jgi:hypothetical protein